MFETLLNEQLAMDPRSARMLMASLAAGQKFSLIDENGEPAKTEKPRITNGASAFAGADGAYGSKPFQYIEGIAVIPVTGALVHRAGFISSYWSGYDAIVSLYNAANADPDVKGILLMINSPGGTVAGCFDACDHLFENKTKPVWSIADDMACSAAMCISSVADRRFVTQTARVGSIGVVQVHSSYENMLDSAGMQVTMIYSGSHKVDGNPYKNLPDEVYQDFKAGCDTLRNQFAEKVSRNTGMSLDDVLATEAKTYTGEEAVTAGVADEVINSHQIINHFLQHLSGTDSNQERSITMSDQAQAATESVRAGAEAEAQAAEAQTPAVNEKQRISAILQSPEAEGKTKLAQHLAFNTDMSVEQVEATLKASASESAPAATTQNPLDIAMSATEQPGIGAMAEDQELSEADQMVQAYSHITGAKK